MSEKTTCRAKDISSVSISLDNLLNYLMGGIFQLHLLQNQKIPPEVNGPWSNSHKVFLWSKVYLLVTSKAYINTAMKLLWNSPSCHSLAPVQVNAPNQHIFQNVGRNRSTRRKPTQTRGEHTNSTQTVTQAGNRTRVPGAVKQQC